MVDITIRANGQSGAIGMPTIGQAPPLPGPQPQAKGGLNFPNDLSKQPYWMSFSFYQYQMPSLIQQNIYYADQGTIRLPLPNTLTDSQHVDYAAEPLQLVGAAAAATAQQIGGAGGIAAGLGVGAAAGVLGGLAGVLGGGAAAAAYKGAQGAGAAALQTAGLAVNPFLSVMFKSPAFKQHSLSWKLMPSNETESRILNNIVNTFRANMLPNQSGALGGTLLTYPNIVQTTISVNNGTYFTFAYKPAVIQNIDINFAAAGQPSFFWNGAPTEVEIRIQLMEIEYWLASDYGFADNSIATQIANALAQPAVQTPQNNGQTGGTQVWTPGAIDAAVAGGGQT
jgi:hypothetical protein